MIQGIEDEGEFLKIDEIKGERESHQLEKPDWKLFWDTGKKERNTESFWAFPLSD